MRINQSPRRRCAGAVLMRAAIRWIRVVVGVPRLAMRVARVSAMSGFPVMTQWVLAVLLVVRQFADFVAFAGPEEDEGDRRRERGGVAEK